MNDREFITSIRDQCNTQLGVTPDSGGGTPAPKPAAAAVVTKPQVSGDLGVGGGAAVITHAGVNAPFGMTFTIRDDAKNERKIRWEGHPGQFWDHNSWAIFDSAGGVALAAENQIVVGTLGYTLDNSVLMLLGAGTYTLGVNVNGAGTLATFFVQN